MINALGMNPDLYLQPNAMRTNQVTADKTHNFKLVLSRCFVQKDNALQRFLLAGRFASNLLYSALTPSLPETASASPQPRRGWLRPAVSCCRPGSRR